MQWEVVIGLETHVQLQTASKIFSGASTAFGASANTQACIIDLALPGVLPVLNAQAVTCAIQLGLAINAHIAPKSIFARKNYFYPDLPKGYQISQYEQPVVAHGTLTISVEGEEKSIRITRAHLEEDAGKSLHEDFQGMSGLDFNRAGTPLLEVVTEPDMRSAQEAVAYAKKLHELVQWIGICDGNMQEGSFRCDANVSVRPVGSTQLGTRREIKNLNSFRFLQQAIEFETRWQIETLEDGGKIVQATVLFDPDTGETRAMRSKEEANDYRYFPDPDLLPLIISADDIACVAATMPELPQAMQTRLEQEQGLSAYDAAGITASRALADYYQATLALMPDQPKLIANWLLGTVQARLNEENLEIHQSPVTPALLAGLLKRISDQSISGKMAKSVFDSMWQSGRTADELITEQGLSQISNIGALEALVSQVLSANPGMVAEYQAGKEKAFNALVGQCMKASKGQANPAQINQILKQKLQA